MQPCSLTPHAVQALEASALEMRISWQVEGDFFTNDCQPHHGGHALTIFQEQTMCKRQMLSNYHHTRKQISFSNPVYQNSVPSALHYHMLSMLHMFQYRVHRNKCILKQTRTMQQSAGKALLSKSYWALQFISCRRIALIFNMRQHETYCIINVLLIDIRQPLKINLLFLY